MFAFWVQTWSDDCDGSKTAMFRKDFDRNVLEYLATKRITHSCKRANRLLQSLTPYKWLSHLSFSTKLMILIPLMNRVQSWLNIVIKIRLPITRFVQLFVLCDAIFYETTLIFWNILQCDAFDNNLSLASISDDHNAAWIIELYAASLSDQFKSHFMSRLTGLSLLTAASRHT